MISFLIFFGLSLRDKLKLHSVCCIWGCFGFSWFAIGLENSTFPEYINISSLCKHLLHPPNCSEPHTHWNTLCLRGILVHLFQRQTIFFSYSFFIYFFAVTSERSKGEIGNHRCFHMSCLITSSFCAAIVCSHVLSRHEFNLAKALYYFTLNNTSKIRWLLLKFVWEQLVWQNFPAFIEKKKLLF